MRQGPIGHPSTIINQLGVVLYGPRLRSKTQQFFSGQSSKKTRVFGWRSYGCYGLSVSSISAVRDGLGWIQWLLLNNRKSPRLVVEHRHQKPETMGIFQWTFPTKINPMMLYQCDETWRFLLLLITQDSSWIQHSYPTLADCMESTTAGHGLIQIALMRNLDVGQN